MHDLSVYERITDPVAAISALGEIIAKSRIFGCESLDQGKVLAWECLARRTPPLNLKETYHLINTSQGATLTMRADAMLAGFLQLGGRHRIVQRDGERAAVELTYAGQTCLFECALAEAKEAGLTDGKKGQKENWSSPRQRMQMLWARAVSDGVRAMAPQVCAGKYTPEDFGATEKASAADDSQIVEGSVVETPPAAAVTEPIGTETAGTKPAGTEAATAEPSKPAASATTDECTAGQRAAIIALTGELGMTPEQIELALQRRQVNSIRSLTEGQATELIWALREKANQVGSAESRQDPEAVTTFVSGPASPQQVAEIKGTLLPALAQTNADLYSRLTAKMRAEGRKFADLSFEQARSLIEQIKLRNLEAFFGESLSLGN